MNPHIKAMLIGGAALSTESYTKYGVFPNEESIVSPEYVNFAAAFLGVQEDKESKWFGERMLGYHRSRCHAGLHYREFKNCLDWSPYQGKPYEKVVVGS